MIFYELFHGHENMSHVMCSDCFVGSRMFDGSHIHFSVCNLVCIMSCDTTGCGVMWKSFLLD